MTWTTSLRRRLWTSAKAKSLPTSQRRVKLVAGRMAPLAGEDHRLRHKEHTRFVSRQPCVVCGRTPADPHHLRFAQPRALGRKASDEYTVPVCRTHHRELHRYRASWWAGFNVDPVPIALGLWQRTRPDRGWNQRPERCKPRTRGKYSSLVQCGRAIHRLKHQREAERQRLSSAAWT